MNAGMLLPTCRASDADRGGRGDLIQAIRGNPNKHFTMPTPRPCSGLRSRGVNQTELERALIPTPQKHDANPGHAERWRQYGTKHGASNLNDWAAKFLPTPANQTQSGGLRLEGGAGGRKRMRELGLLPTPTKQDSNTVAGPSQMDRNTPPLNTYSARSGTGTAGLLILVEWMMGYPKRWLLAAALAVPSSPPTVMPSFRKSRR